MSNPATKAIPTLLNIAPRGMTWKNWQLVKDADGFPTRESMEKFYCNPERVRALEYCTRLDLEAIKRLNTQIEQLIKKLAASDREQP